jgi:transcription-repair coupling factor (superfamily II helicase)
MDRLVCGDVGYGKTEVALRAAFKAVLDNKQVAVLVPTTVLAQQHFKTFVERLQAFPVRVEVLSRFRSEKDTKKVLADLAVGAVDICIGTHRLIQRDVQFHNLGLVIIDEEQRFGVMHKERLKQLRKEVDVLTLTATPIPRTLHMAMVGVRDMSTMETPPEDRLPIKTFVTEFDNGLIREAILRELDRGGQVYFVHNRVQNIHFIAEQLRKLVPEAAVAVGHGQMHEDQLERVMLDFANGKHDVLVCSTIIESGLDIPNVNTIIVNQADRFGLAQLYQLRGRVGRGAVRAYAYFLYNKEKTLTPQAEKRLRTMFEATELGSGFRIAMRDLEIRGAGNLLGAEQHGHVAAVGFTLYCQLLAEAIQEYQGQVVERPPEIKMDLPVMAFLPSDYVTDDTMRLSVYQKMAAINSLDAVSDMARELIDRFGTPPREVVNLICLLEVKHLASVAGIESLEMDGDQIVLMASPGRLDKAALVKALGPAVQVGHRQARIYQPKLGKEWLVRLRDALEQIVDAQTGSNN